VYHPVALRFGAQRERRGGTGTDRPTDRRRRGRVLSWPLSLNPSARSISRAGVQCDLGHGRSERTDTRESGAHCFWVVVRGIKVLITVRSAALAVFLSIAAIPAFLLLTGTNVVVAVVGALATIAMWLGIGWVVDRLFSEWF
jgi:hypothetical protein